MSRRFSALLLGNHVLSRMCARFMFWRAERRVANDDYVPLRSA